VSSRPLPVTVAVVLLALLGVGNLLAPLISSGIPTGRPATCWSWWG
jgi:hypothetical protein